MADQVTEKIDATVIALRRARAEAQGDPAALAKIEKRFDEIDRLDAAWDRQQLLGAAAALNELSDIVDGIIRDIGTAVSNFFLDDLLTLKREVDGNASDANAEIRHQPAIPTEGETTGESSPAPAPDADDRKHAAALAKLFTSLEIRNDHWRGTADWIINRFIDPANRARYEKVADATGVPWPWIAITHSLETGVNFNLHLHNGDPLTARTVRVPAGRPRTGSPPFSWFESAIDALTMEGHSLDRIDDWSLASMLFQWEKYNGFGYRKRDLLSPYLFSGCQHYVRGKFVADGVFDPDFVSEQVGAAVVLKRMVERKIVDGIGTVDAPVVIEPKSSIGPIGLQDIDVTPFDHASDEIDWPSRLTPPLHADQDDNKSRKAATRQVQEWVSYHGSPTKVDGDFGNGTKRSVLQFQRAAGLPETGAVDEATWLHLTLPMRRALLAADTGDRNLYEIVLAVGERHLDERPEEFGGNNMGMWVRLYMEGKQGVIQRWCAGFVCTIVAQAARDLGIAMPIKRQVGVDQLVDDAKRDGRFVSETELGSVAARRMKLQPGCIFVWRKSANDWAHTGLVRTIEDDSFSTIEGNTDTDSGSNDGNVVTSRSRRWKGYDFVLLA